MRGIRSDHTVITRNREGLISQCYVVDTCTSAGLFGAMHETYEGKERGAMVSCEASGEI